MNIPTRLAILAVLTSLGCANSGDRFSNTLFPKTPNTFETKQEVVVVSFSCNEDPKCTKAPPRPPLVAGSQSTGLQSQALGGAEIAAVASLLIDKFAEFLEKESERYTATYSAVAVNDRFYDGWYPDSSMHVRGIEIGRTVRGGSHAATIKLQLDPTADETAFQLKPSYVHVERSKAKLARFALLDPISWFSGADRDLDFTVHVKLHAVWRDKNRKVHVRDIAAGEFKIRNLELGKKYGVGGVAVPGGSSNGDLFPMVERSYIGETNRADEYALLDAEALNKALKSALPPDGKEEEWKKAKDPLEKWGLQVRSSGWAPQVVAEEEKGRSQHPHTGVRAPIGMRWFKTGTRTPVLGTGNFIVSVLVTEHDDYGKKVKETAATLEQNRGAIVEQLKTSLGDE